MANPYQQPGAQGYGTPQYYMQAGGMYPGAYYAAPTYVTAPAAGQPYGVSIYGVPTAMPQYQVAQQPAVVAVPQVRAMANPLDSMFGSKPAAVVTLTPTVAKPSATLSDVWNSNVSSTQSPSAPAAQTDFGSFTSAPPAAPRAAPVLTPTPFAPTASPPVLTPSPFSSMPMASTAPVRSQPPMATAPRTADDDFGGFVSAAPSVAKPPATASPFAAPMPVSASFAPSVPATLMSYAAAPAPAVVAMPKSAPVLMPQTTPPHSSVANPTPSLVTPSTPAARPPTAAPVAVSTSFAPVAAVQTPTPAAKPAPSVMAPPPVSAPTLPPTLTPTPAPPSASATPSASAAADESRHPKTSKKAVDWNKVNYVNVFADIEQENALAAQFTPVTAAPAPSAPSVAASSATPQPAIGTQQQQQQGQQDEWGSFQAPASSPAPASIVPQPSASRPAAVPNPAMSAGDWGPMVNAHSPSPVAPAMPTPSHFGGASLNPAAPNSTAPSSSAAGGLLPPSTAQTASALFSSFSGLPVSSLAAPSVANTASVMRSTAPPALATTAAAVAALSGPLNASFGAAAVSPIAPAVLSPRMSAASDVDFGDFSGPTTRSVAPTVTPAPPANASRPSGIPSSSASVSSVAAIAPTSAPSASLPSSLSALGTSPVFSSYSFKHPATPTSNGFASASPDDFGDFAGASPLPTAPALATNTPLPLVSSAKPAAVAVYVAPPLSLPSPADVDFGDFAAPVSTSPAPVSRLSNTAAPPATVNAPKQAPSAIDFGELSAALPSALPTSVPAVAVSAASSAASAAATAISALAPSLPPSVTLSVQNSLTHSLVGSVDSGAAFAPFNQLSPAPASSLTPAAVGEDEWGGFEAAKSAASAASAPPPSNNSATPAPPSAAPKAAEAPRAMLSAEALLGRAMRVLETRSEDDFGSFASAAPTPPPPAVAKTNSGASGGGSGGGFGFLFAGPPLASALAASPGSPMVATVRPERPASDSLTDVLAFLVRHERLEEATACKMLIESGKSAASSEQMKRWCSLAPPAGHLTAEEMRKQLGDALGAAALDKYASKFGDLSEAASTDLVAATAQQKQAQALFKRLLATKGVDLTDARRAALQAIATELTVAQDFASHVLLKSSLAGAEEEAVKRGVWNSAKGNAFFRGLSELHLVYRRIAQAINEEGSDIMLSSLLASVAVAWNTLFATLASEAKRIEQEAPLLSSKDSGSVCAICGLPAASVQGGASPCHASCSNLQRHAATARH